jgi:hypothetical protein
MPSDEDDASGGAAPSVSAPSVEGGAHASGAHASGAPSIEGGGRAFGADSGARGTNDDAGCVPSAPGPRGSVLAFPEELRFASLPSSCTAPPQCSDGVSPTGGFGWTHSDGSLEDLKTPDNLFVAQAVLATGGWTMGSQVSQGCTSYARVPNAWRFVQGSSADIDRAVAQTFAQPGRIVDIDTFVDGAGALAYSAVLVSNAGANQRNAWWGHGATLADLLDVIGGRAWDTIPDDAVPKRLIDLEVEPGGTFAFVANDYDEAFWYWVDKDEQFIDDQLAGTSDGTPKQIVSIDVELTGITVVLGPKKADSWWASSVTWPDVVAFATAHDARVALLKPALNPGSYVAVFVKNAPEGEIPPDGGETNDSGETNEGGDAGPVTATVLQSTNRPGMNCRGSGSFEPTYGTDGEVLNATGVTSDVVCPIARPLDSGFPNVIQVPVVSALDGSDLENVCCHLLRTELDGSESQTPVMCSQGAAAGGQFLAPAYTLTIDTPDPTSSVNLICSLPAATVAGMSGILMYRSALARASP